jgi:lipoyl-dependent peroxiredoxin
MAIRNAKARWEGSLKEGKGTMSLGSGAFDGSYSYVSRFEEGPGTNPEELIGAAHAGCFSMAFSGELGKAGFSPRWIETQAEVKLEPVDGKNTISIHLIMQADVPDIDEARFQEIAEAAKKGCPVSRALSATKITLDANLA